MYRIQFLLCLIPILSFANIPSAKGREELAKVDAPAEEAKVAVGMDRAIKERLAGKVDISDMRLDVMWGGRGAATVYGAGVGIWNREKQFNLKKAQLLDLLKILDEGKFAKLKSGYGGFARPLGGPAIGAPEVLVGSITIRLGNLTIGSMQRGGGEQSKELAAIAGRLLDVCEKAAEDGVTTDSLSDGLTKIAAGKLHPLTMSLLVQRIENEGRGPNGWILRVNGRRAEVQLRSRAGMSSPIRAELTAMQLDGLCKLLIDNKAADLPINLYAPDYTDFRVSILQTKKSLQARKFARLTPTTHGEKQKNFDRIFAGLDALQQRVVKKGKREGVSVMRQAGFIVKDDPKADAVVLKSAEDLAKAVHEEMRVAAKGMNLDQLDFTKYMVVVVKSGRTNAFGVRVTINKVEVAADRKSATIQWTYRPYFGGAAPPEQIGNPGAIAIVERFDGGVQFKKSVYQWPKGLPLPPSAGPPLRAPRLTPVKQ